MVEDQKKKLALPSLDSLKLRGSQLEGDMHPKILKKALEEIDIFINDWDMNAEEAVAHYMKVSGRKLPWEAETNQLKQISQNMYSQLLNATEKLKMEGLRKKIRRIINEDLPSSRLPVGFEEEVFPQMRIEDLGKKIVDISKGMLWRDNPNDYIETLEDVQADLAKWIKKAKDELV